jgi:predicted TIM-barrel fold metal-dependent hydrolase
MRLLRRLTFAAAFVGGFGAARSRLTAQDPRRDPPRDPMSYALNDSHFHLTNYVQEGPTLTRFLQMMGKTVGRVALFGIPLQQEWSYRIDGANGPTYYLGSDAPLYYYSFTDAMIAMAYRALSPETQARFDPMITGFNPADMYAAAHIRRVLKTFPGVFSGIGEFTIHKEFVSPKVAGTTASLTDPALDSILSFAGEAGLVVIMHNDVNVPFAKPGSAEASLNLPSAPPVPEYLAQMRALLARHPATTVIWAHTGLGRTVRPISDHVKMLSALIEDPALPNLYFDISWKVVADYVTASDSSLTATAALLNRFPDRFLFGTDALSPPDSAAYLEVFKEYGPLWKRLTPAASEKVRLGNYLKLFDEARGRVRAWERANTP